VPTRYFLIILAWALLPACVNLSNREDLKRYAPFQRVQRLAVFIQHWPVYLQKPGRNCLGDDFIKPQTVFFGPWQPAAQINPRAVDIADIDFELVGNLVVRILEKKGYQVVLATLPEAGENDTVQMLMRRYQESFPPVDAFLFCYFAPTLFVSHAQEAPRYQAKKSYSLWEIASGLSMGTDWVIWVGQRDRNSPANSLSHAFIYLAMSIFDASTGRTIMAQADSRIGGQVRPWIPRCPPAPTNQDYPASPEIIRKLMLNNFQCRLEHEIPYAFSE
jgi:hypothetical protein